MKRIACLVVALGFSSPLFAQSSSSSLPSLPSLLFVFVVFVVFVGRGRPSGRPICVFKYPASPRCAALREVAQPRGPAVWPHHAERRHDSEASRARHRCPIHHLSVRMAIRTRVLQQTGGPDGPQRMGVPAGRSRSGRGDTESELAGRTADEGWHGIRHRSEHHACRCGTRGCRRGHDPRRRHQRAGHACGGAVKVRHARQRADGIYASKVKNPNWPRRSRVLRGQRS